MRPRTGPIQRITNSDTPYTGKLSIAGFRVRHRSKLHRSLGERLMAACTAGRRELASELALHFEEGRDYEQATRCLTACC